MSLEQIEKRFDAAYKMEESSSFLSFKSKYPALCLQLDHQIEHLGRSHAAKILLGVSGALSKHKIFEACMQDYKNFEEEQQRSAAKILIKYARPNEKEIVLFRGLNLEYNHAIDFRIRKLSSFSSMLEIARNFGNFLLCVRFLRIRPRFRRCSCAQSFQTRMRCCSLQPETLSIESATLYTIKTKESG